MQFEVSSRHHSYEVKHKPSAVERSVEVIRAVALCWGMETKEGLPSEREDKSPLDMNQKLLKRCNFTERQDSHTSRFPL